MPITLSLFRLASPDPPPEPPDLSSIPAEYHDLEEVFNNAKALSLPPHRPYDYAIHLVPGATLALSKLYQLSKPDKQEIENYIHDSLVAGLIQPSPSPVGARFFFVDKDKSLKACIDYRGLNGITAQNTYPYLSLTQRLNPFIKLKYLLS